MQFTVKVKFTGKRQFPYHYALYEKFFICYDVMGVGVSRKFFSTFKLCILKNLYFVRLNSNASI